MVELVIASGKGGTGKTSIVGSFAAIAHKPLLVDCDVDAANLHLIIKHQVIESHDFSSSSRASIIDDQCTSCGICEEKCRFDAISHQLNPNTQAETNYRVDPYACDGCGLCKYVCPDDAIAFESVISGKWFKSDSEYGPFFHARLGIAEANSGKLVSLLRKKALETAEKEKREIIIIDGSPGIGCPVIASLTGATYLLIVTEPSLSAIHDMKRLAELAGHFNIKAGLCINKSDLNEDLSKQIENYALEKGILVHGSIPFDNLFTEAQIKGRPYTTIANPEKVSILKGIWESVNEELTVIGNKSDNKEAI